MVLDTNFEDVQNEMRFEPGSDYSATSRLNASACHGKREE